MARPVTRRQFLGAGSALVAALPFRAFADEAKPKSRLILLGTAGGPTPKPNRSAPANVVVVNGASYVVDCGNGVARQMVLAKLKLSSMRGVFLTHPTPTTTPTTGTSSCSRGQRISPSAWTPMGHRRSRR